MIKVNLSREMHFHRCSCELWKKYKDNTKNPDIISDVVADIDYHEQKLLAMVPENLLNQLPL